MAGGFSLFLVWLLLQADVALPATPRAYIASCNEFFGYQHSPEMKAHLIAQITEMRPELVRYAQSRLSGNQKTSAEDFTQEAMAQAISKLYLFDAGPRSNLRGWVKTILKHLIFRQTQRKKNQPMASLDDDEHPINNSHTTTEASQETSSVMTDLQFAIRRLPPEFREAIVLVGLQDKTYQQASDELKVPKHVVAYRITRGRALLKDLLENGSSSEEADEVHTGKLGEVYPELTLDFDLFERSVPTWWEEVRRGLRSQFFLSFLASLRAAQSPFYDRLLSVKDITNPDLQETYTQFAYKALADFKIPQQDEPEVQKVARQLNQLSPIERQVFFMLEIAQLSENTVAQLLNKSSQVINAYWEQIKSRHLDTEVNLIGMQTVKRSGSGKSPVTDRIRVFEELFQILRIKYTNQNRPPITGDELLELATDNSNWFTLNENEFKDFQIAIRAINKLGTKGRQALFLVEVARMKRRRAFRLTDASQRTFDARISVARAQITELYEKHLGVSRPPPPPTPSRQLSAFRGSKTDDIPEFEELFQHLRLMYRLADRPLISGSEELGMTSDNSESPPWFSLSESDAEQFSKSIAAINKLSGKNRQALLLAEVAQLTAAAAVPLAKANTENTFNRRLYLARIEIVRAYADLIVIH